jgi:S-adenosylmethionine-diacylgycerolhomoserine-N-methlytransferase
LEIGCGTAWNLAALADAYPKARLMGIDVSAAMLETARASLERKGLAGRVTLRQGDATSFDAAALFGIAGFDRVVISYALSMIPCWREALDHGAGLVAAGGELHITDFGQCAGLPAIARRALFAFLERFSVMPRPDLEQRCHEAAAKYGLTVRFERMHRGYADYVVLSRPAAT